MARIEGTHAQRGSARLVRYGAEYEVAGNTIHFRAWFDGGATHEGEFADIGATVNAWLGGKAPGRGIPGTPILQP